MSSQVPIKHIAVLTSGGDAPGMNAAIRAVVRTSLHYHIQVSGIQHGYQGLIENEVVSLDSNSVSNIIQRGGTILKTARSEEFRNIEGREKAFKVLKHRDIDALIVIGGDGTFTGAKIFSDETKFPIMGIAGTIDNDLWGTDFTIGYDTAINTVVSAVDKIRDTAESHDRLFIVEVMGRDSGLIALMSGIGIGADAILVPELESDTDALIQKLSLSTGVKTSHIVLVAEGDELGGAYKIANFIEQKFPNKYDVRVSVLGHLQRGGAPTCMDRVLASRLGASAVEALLNGRRGEMVGIVNNAIHYVPFQQAVKYHTELNPALLKLTDILA